MHYIQFFQRAATDPKLLVPACGDRAVVIIDGRINGFEHHAIAMDEKKARGYDAYQIRRGDTFTRSQPLTGLMMDLDLLVEGCDARPEDIN